MQVVNQGGPPPMPPGSHRRFRSRRGGFWSNFASQGVGFKLNVIASVFGLFLIIGYLVWRFIIPHSDDVAQAQTQPTQGGPTMIQTVGPITASNEIPPEPLSPEQIQATATFQAAISRPAAMNNPAAAPFFVGVVTYEAGCDISNIGFTTAGYNGQPFYLYFNQPLDRDPAMQMANVTGFVQEFDGCQHPVIMVQQIYWLDQQGTPSPLVYLGTITGTATVTATSVVWGQGVPTPNKHATPIYDPPSWTATPYPTYTPFATPTPYVPPPRSDPPTPKPWPTYTPFPTWTPNPDPPTATPTNTPALSTIYGRVVAVGGCAASNFALQASSDGQPYYILFDGAQLPPGSPTQYEALATGVIGSACSGKAIYARQIQWYPLTPTSTPTLTATPTLTPTHTATPTLTPTTEITSTAVITP